MGRRLRLALAALLGFCALLGGCGGDGGGGGGAGTPEQGDYQREDPTLTDDTDEGRTPNSATDSGSGTGEGRGDG